MSATIVMNDYHYDLLRPFMENEEIEPTPEDLDLILIQLKRLWKYSMHNASGTIDKIIEISHFCPIITQSCNKENVRLLDVVYSVSGAATKADFTVNGLGYSIDFFEGTASRNTDLDLK